MPTDEARLPDATTVHKQRVGMERWWYALVMAGGIWAAALVPRLLAA